MHVFSVHFDNGRRLWLLLFLHNVFIDFLLVCSSACFVVFVSFFVFFLFSFQYFVVCVIYALNGAIFSMFLVCLELFVSLTQLYGMLFVHRSMEEY